MLLMLKNDIHVHSIAHDNEIYILVIQKKKKPSFRSQDNFQQHSTQMFTRMIGGKRKLKWSMFPLAPERFSCKIIALGVNEDFSSRTSSFVLLVLGFSGDGANESKGEHIALIQLPVGVCVGVSITRGWYRPPRNLPPPPYWHILYEIPTTDKKI